MNQSEIYKQLETITKQVEQLEAELYIYKRKYSSALNQVTWMQERGEELGLVLGSSFLEEGLKIISDFWKNNH